MQAFSALEDPSSAQARLVLLDSEVPPTSEDMTVLLPPRLALDYIAATRGLDAARDALTHLSKNKIYDNSAAFRMAAVSAGSFSVFDLARKSPQESVRKFLKSARRRDASTLCVDVRFIEWGVALELLAALGTFRGDRAVIVINYAGLAVDTASALKGTGYPRAVIDEQLFIRDDRGGTRIVKSTAKESTPTRLARFVEGLSRTFSLSGPVSEAVAPKPPPAQPSWLRVDRGPYGSSLSRAVPQGKMEFANLSGLCAGGFDPHGRDPWCEGHRGSFSIRVEGTLASCLRL